MCVVCISLIFLIKRFILISLFINIESKSSLRIIKRAFNSDYSEMPKSHYFVPISCSVECRVSVISKGE